MLDHLNDIQRNCLQLHINDIFSQLRRILMGKISMKHLRSIRLQKNMCFHWDCIQKYKQCIFWDRFNYNYCMGIYIFSSMNCFQYLKLFLLDTVSIFQANSLHKGPGISDIGLLHSCLSAKNPSDIQDTLKLELDHIHCSWEDILCRFHSQSQKKQTGTPNIWDCSCSSRNFQGRQDRSFFSFSQCSCLRKILFCMMCTLKSISHHSFSNLNGTVRIHLK